MVSATLPCLMWHMVWLEKTSSLCPCSGPSGNLQSGGVWMKGSCHRRRYNFWQDLNSYSFYKSCWNTVLVRVDDILKDPFLYPYCSYRSVKLRIRCDLGWHISESHNSSSSTRAGSGEREKCLLLGGGYEEHKSVTGLFAGICWTKLFVCTWGAS